MIAARNEYEIALAVYGNAARLTARSPGRNDGAAADVNCDDLPGFLKVCVETAMQIVYRIAFG